MAIRKENIGLIDKAAEAIGKKYSDGLKMCELGNQYVKDDPNFKTAKEYFTSLGVNHTSIDTNGEDGAIKVDLSIISKEHQNEFDIVTNYGTSEHVKQQYEVFANIHNWTRVGGAMVHCLPQAGYWYYHGKFNYELAFFTRLAECSGYKFVSCESVKKLDGQAYMDSIYNGPKRPPMELPTEQYNCGAILIKQDAKPFMHRSEFYRMGGLVLTGKGDVV